MPDRLIIRAESPDQPEVRALLAGLDSYLASLYPPEANHIVDVQGLLAPEVTFYVAREGCQPVGTGAVRRMAGAVETDGQPFGEIKRMYVDPAFRGREIGIKLLDVIESQLRNEGIRLALLETGAHQTQAVRLYQRCGYTPRGAFAGYPDNGLSVFYGKAI
jgi:putative acetyltransferase